MLIVGERPEYVDKMTDRLKKLANKLFEDLPDGKRVVLSKLADLYTQESQDSLFIMQSGNVAAYQGERLCFYYEAGDLIGLTDCYQLPSLRVSIDDSSEVIHYDADTLLKHVTSTKELQSVWTSYLITLVALFQDAFSRFQTTTDQPNTGFMTFAPGDTIIRQGDDAHEVFTILSGNAEAFVDDVKVGEILQDEIFGAMAVFTNEKRSATVKAKAACTVLAVPREEFITLIKSHPQTTMTLIENMARQISTLNAQISHH